MEVASRWDQEEPSDIHRNGSETPGTPVSLAWSHRPTAEGWWAQGKPDGGVVRRWAADPAPRLFET